MMLHFRSSASPQPDCLWQHQNGIDTKDATTQENRAGAESVGNRGDGATAWCGETADEHICVGMGGDGRGTDRESKGADEAGQKRLPPPPPPSLGWFHLQNCFSHHPHNEPRPPQRQMASLMPFRATYWHYNLCLNKAAAALSWSWFAPTPHSVLKVSLAPCVLTWHLPLFMI